MDSRPESEFRVPAMTGLDSTLAETEVERIESRCLYNCRDGASGDLSEIAYVLRFDSVKFGSARR